MDWATTIAARATATTAVTVGATDEGTTTQAVVGDAVEVTAAIKVFLNQLLQPVVDPAGMLPCTAFILLGLQL
ncbi:hypothetical protein JN27_19080 [Massilia sp. BSC265]|nr:hypothetical protein JN27_19080 [Massilia sp. BSC265]